MTNETMNEPAAELAATLERTSVLIRPGDLKKLASLLKKLDKLTDQEREIEALHLKLKKQIADALESGDLDERLANSLATRRGQMELIPAKLAQLQSAREVLERQLEEELTACIIDFNRRFAGLRGMLSKHVESFLRPLLVEDFMLEYRVAAHIIPYAKPLRKAGGLLSYVQHSANLRNFAESARHLLKHESESAEIIAEVKDFCKSTAKE